MTASDLRSNLHEIVDRIDDSELLQVVYDFLKNREQKASGQLWASLSEHQKKEVYLSYKESEDENNLVEKDNVFKSSE